jgi:hypothetical protein
MGEHYLFFVHLINGGMPPGDFCGIGAMPEPDTIETPGQTNPVPDRASGRETGSFDPLIAPNKANLPKAKMGVIVYQIEAYVNMLAFRVGENKAKQSQLRACPAAASRAERTRRGVVDGAVLRYAGRCEVGKTWYWFLSGWRHTL